MHKPIISIVIPVYNNEESLSNTYIEITKALNQKKINYEIVFVDDGSTDKSLSIIEALTLQDGFVTVVKLVRNFGQHSATLAGIKQAKGDIIVTIDADLQNDPHDIPKLIDKMKNGYQVVNGARKSGQIPFIKFIRSYFINWCIFFITGTKLKDSTSTFKAYSKEIINSALKVEHYMKFLPVYICWIGARITEIDVEYRPRKTGKSQYNLFKLIILCFEWLLLFSSGIRTVILLLFMGGCFILLSIILFLCCFFSFMSNPDKINSILLISSTFFFFGGINFIVLGILSERIKQLQVIANNQPLYFIEKIISKKNM